LMNSSYSTIFSKKTVLLIPNLPPPYKTLFFLNNFLNYNKTFKKPNNNTMNIFKPNPTSKIPNDKKKFKINLNSEYYFKKNNYFFNKL
jgi:hypothetical protein